MCSEWVRSHVQEDFTVYGGDGTSWAERTVGLTWARFVSGSGISDGKVAQQVFSEWQRVVAH